MFIAPPPIIKYVSCNQEYYLYYGGYYNIYFYKKSSASTRNSGRQADIFKPSLPDRFGEISFEEKEMFTFKNISFNINYLKLFLVCRNVACAVRTFCCVYVNLTKAIGTLFGCQHFLNGLFAKGHNLVYKLYNQENYERHNDEID